MSTDVLKPILNENIDIIREESFNELNKNSNDNYIGIIKKATKRSIDRLKNIYPRYRTNPSIKIVNFFIKLNMYKNKLSNPKKVITDKILVTILPKDLVRVLNASRKYNNTMRYVNLYVNMVNIIVSIMSQNIIDGNDIVIGTLSDVISSLKKFDVKLDYAMIENTTIALYNIITEDPFSLIPNTQYICTEFINFAISLYKLGDLISSNVILFVILPFFISLLISIIAIVKIQNYPSLIENIDTLDRGIGYTEDKFKLINDRLKNTRLRSFFNFGYKRLNRRASRTARTASRTASRTANRRRSKH